MTRVRAVFGRAVSAHREAVAQLRAARDALDVDRAGDTPTDRAALAERARRLADRLAPGWLGADWTTAADLPVGRDASPAAPVPVRIGTAMPGDDARHPAVVPLLGAGHLAVDVAAPELFAGVLLRLVAAAPAGLLRVCWLGPGLPAPFGPLRAAGMLLEADEDTALAAADRQLRHVADAVRAGQDPATLPYLLVVVARQVPMARLRPLAEQGPAGRLHLLLGDQPAPLPHTVSVRTGSVRSGSVRSGSVRSGSVRTGSVSSGGTRGAGAPDDGGLAAVAYGAATAPSVRLAGAPPAELVDAVCRRLAGSLRPGFGALVPGRRWAERSATGLRTPIGVGADGVAELVCAEPTPHWLVSGTPRAAGAVALTAAYGLASRYSPDELGLYLLDGTGSGLFGEFAPSPADRDWLPHARYVGAGRAVSGVLRELLAEVAARRELLARFGLTGLPADLSTVDRAVPRLLLVLAGADLVLSGSDAAPAGPVPRTRSGGGASAQPPYGNGSGDDAPPAVSTGTALPPSRDAALSRSRDAALPRSRDAAVPPSRDAALSRSRDAALPRSRDAAVPPSRDATLPRSRDAGDREPGADGRQAAGSRADPEGADGAVGGGTRDGDRTGDGVGALLAELAATGGPVGVHLLVCAERATAAVLGRLPGRLAVSDVDGTGTVLGRAVRLIDPYADPAQRSRLRAALWQARTPGSAPPQTSAAAEPTSLAGE